MMRTKPHNKPFSLLEESRDYTVEGRITKIRKWKEKNRIGTFLLPSKVPQATDALHNWVNIGTYPRLHGKICSDMRIRKGTPLLVTYRNGAVYLQVTFTSNKSFRLEGNEYHELYFEVTNPKYAKEIQEAIKGMKQSYRGSYPELT